MSISHHFPFIFQVAHNNNSSSTMRHMYSFSTNTTDNPPLPGDVDKGSRFSPGTRRHGRFTFPPAAIFVGTALLLNAVAIIFGSGFGGKGSLRLGSLALVENEDTIDNSVEVIEERGIIPADIAEARGDDSKKEDASILTKKTTTRAEKCTDTKFLPPLDFPADVFKGQFMSQDSEDKTLLDNFCKFLYDVL